MSRLFSFRFGPKWDVKSNIVPGREGRSWEVQWRRA